MRVRVVTPPEPIVSRERAKEHLRVLHTREDELIDAYVEAATAHLDGPTGWLGRALGVQELEMYLPAFGTCNWFALPYPPVIEMLAIEYVDDTGAKIALDAGAYELGGSMVRPAWPSSFPLAAWRGAGGQTVRVHWRAGYEKVPAPVTAAILLMVGDLYANRETTAAGISSTHIPMSTTVENLLAPLRVYR